MTTSDWKCFAGHYRPSDNSAPQSPDVAPTHPWWQLCRCLTATIPETLPQLEATLKRLLDCGASAFEVIAGTPFARYGARIAFRHERPEVLARTFGFEHHPWGAPSWVGVRVARGGELRAKAYHRVHRIDSRFELPTEWPRDLYPVMASLDGEAVELYLRKQSACGFPEFAARCLAPLCSTLPPFSPAPRPRDDAFCVSVRRNRGALAAISIYADWRALPSDTDIETAWSEGLDAADLMTYRLAFAGVQSMGFFVSGNWHAMLAWTVEASGQQHRAVSFAVPHISSDRVAANRPNLAPLNAAR